MEFHFLWIIGGALFLGWLIVHLFFLGPHTVRFPEFKPARSWYSVPVIGLVMVLTWVFIQIAQSLS